MIKEYIPCPCGSSSTKEKILKTKAKKRNNNKKNHPSKQRAEKDCTRRGHSLIKIIHTKPLTNTSRRLKCLP